jgi:hypothetical protein
MRSRPIVICTIAVGLVAGGSALAAPKPVCKLVVDPEGDGTHRATGLKSPALDILSADVSTGKKEVVGIIRLKTTNTSSDPLARLGMNWSLAFQIAGKNYAFSASRRTNIITGAATDNGATFDATSITWRAPRKDFDPLVKKPGKHVIEGIAAESWVYGGSADTATATPATKYRDFYPSCLKAN